MNLVASGDHERLTLTQAIAHQACPPSWFHRCVRHKGDRPMTRPEHTACQDQGSPDRELLSVAEPMRDIPRLHGGVAA
ncbi:MAG: hypothetical protein HY815_05135 [Candidatus Riflebacteria bacterium]|nr:hypothetical protein [Candidatus Riflebacteria bacterium]